MLPTHIFDGSGYFFSFELEENEQYCAQLKKPIVGQGCDKVVEGVLSTPKPWAPSSAPPKVNSVKMLSVKALSW